MTLRGEDFSIEYGTVDGSRISFEIAGRGQRAQFAGELEQSSLRGTMKRGARTLSWTATKRTC